MMEPSQAANLADGVYPQMGSDIGIKITGFGACVHLFERQKRRGKQAGGAIVIVHMNTNLCRGMPSIPTLFNAVLYLDVERLLQW